MKKPRQQRSEIPSISLAMIVRDEEQFLGGCLESVRGAVDEIVVVDTGSTDRTVEIAKNFGAKVYSFEWADDFAAARNEALRHCNCDWVLSLDADERLTGDSTRHIRAETAREDVDAWYLTLAGVSATGEEHPPVRLLRMFRRTAKGRYFGRIHEQIDLGISGIVGGHSRAVIRHLGYDPEVYRSRGKEERNKRILAQALTDSQSRGDVVLQSCYLYYSIFHEPARRKLRKLEEFAEFCAEHADSLPARVAWVPSGLMLLALELRAAGFKHRAGSVAEQMLERYGGAPYLHALVSDSLLSAGKLEGAEKYARQALDPACATNSCHEEYVIDPALAAQIAAPVLGEILEHFGRDDEAEQLYRRFSGSLEKLQTRLALFEIRRGEYDSALARLGGLANRDACGEFEAVRLGFIASIASRSIGGLVCWGDRLQNSARIDSRSAALLETAQRFDLVSGTSKDILFSLLRSAGFVAVDEE